MKRSLRTSHWIVCLLLLCTAGCSTRSDNHNATANDNAAAVATANANAASVTAQPATPMATAAPPAASPVPIVTPPTTKPSTEPAAKPTAKENAAHAAGPKLVMVSQERDLDFGKQPQDKTLVRPIRIRNGGSAALNIESVSPS